MMLIEPVIESFKAREILDSRGNPTVEVDAILKTGIMGRASVPSGASTGIHEAVELRDHNPKRYGGRGVLNAVEHVHTVIAPHLVERPMSQQSLDEHLNALDGTLNKSKLGANALLAVSLSVAKASALQARQPLHVYLSDLLIKQGLAQPKLTLPVPMMNILNGGAHADNNVDIQEFMILPIGASTFADALEMGVSVFHTLKGLLKKRGLSTAVGDEGGFAPNLRSNQEALDIILSAIHHAGLTAGQDIYLGLDVASSEWYQNEQYHLASENKSFSKIEWVEYLSSWVNQYPIITIEDAMAEEDWEGWKYFTNALSSKIQCVGDDIFVTNPKILERGIREKVGNAVLIKPNQIGTLTETLMTIAMALSNGYNAVISHRSGETEDTIIADLAVASGCGQIKTGAPCRTDRTSKYNQLLRIASDNTNLPYAGKSAFERFIKR